MPITKSSGANQPNREVVMAEMCRSLPPDAELARGRQIVLADPDPCDVRSPRQDVYPDGLVRHR